ncbi:MAG: alpha-isopropylmalate synthase regulatory domain-containing protein [Bacteroidales bacterium]
MDTTLRDGEQTSGVSFSELEKLNIARKLLADVNVDRIEIASARVSKGEFEATRKIIDWAGKNGCLNQIEVLGFLDGTKSLEWIEESGARVVNLLTKGSINHLKHQLRKSREEHIEDIRTFIHRAIDMGLEVNVYLEDWSNGMKSSKDYVFYYMDQLKDEPVKRFMLPDTLGILDHEEVYQYCSEMFERYPDLHFDFHAHNDYDLSVANSYAGLYAGMKGVHTTVNGMGERAGNAPLSSVVGMIKDHTDFEINVEESQLYSVSKLVESFSAIRIPSNKPLIGENVFTQTCGVHADGDSKSQLYFNALLPERFGRKRKYALGKTSGKANIKKNLEEWGISLDPESMEKVTQRVIELGDKKEHVSSEDLPYIVSDVLNTNMVDEKIKVVGYTLSLTKGLRPVASLNVEIDNQQYQETSEGDGQYDAFMKALKKIYSKLEKEFPKLTDYMVTIPPGGNTDALVETVITWNYRGEEFKTRGLDADQIESAIKATTNMLNLLENRMDMQGKNQRKMQTSR